MMGFGLGLSLWSLGGMLIFWTVLVAIAVWIIKWLFPSMPASADRKYDASPTTETMLKIRYARGELSQEQYQKMVQLLHK